MNTIVAGIGIILVALSGIATADDWRTWPSEELKAWMSEKEMLRPDEVRRRLGKPDEVARSLVSKGTTQVVWIYRLPDDQSIEIELKGLSGPERAGGDHEAELWLSKATLVRLRKDGVRQQLWTVRPQEGMTLWQAIQLIKERQIPTGDFPEEKYAPRDGTLKG